MATQLSTKRKSILLEALLKDVASKSPELSDESLRRIYDSSPEQFRTGPRVRVSHMLFRDKARAEETLRRIEEGEPFEALMKETGAYEGEVAADLGDIERGHFVKEFEEAAFGAAPGEVAGPVKTAYGYHLIKVYSKKPAGIRSFEEVQAPAPRGAAGDGAAGGVRDARRRPAEGVDRPRPGRTGGRGKERAARAGEMTPAGRFGARPDGEAGPFRRGGAALAALRRRAVLLLFPGAAAVRPTRRSWSPKWTTSPFSCGT